MRDTKLEDRVAIFCVAYVVVLVWFAICGCDSPQRRPSKPCCPGGCKPAIQVLWFSAEWCGPCKRQASDAARAVAGYNCRKVDIDAEPVLARIHNVRSVPTYIVVVNGRERARTQDAMELSNLLGR